MNDLQVLGVGGKLLFTADFTADVPTGVAVTGISWSVDPVGLTLSGQTDDLANKQSSIFVDGMAHGVTYQVKVLATLDNGEIVPKVWTGRGFNG